MRTPLKFKQHLVCFYLVRLHMTIIVLSSTAAGLLVSKILLETGLTNMLVRYPLSVLGAYVIFLGLARLWSSYVLWRESARLGSAGSPDWLELLDGASPPGHSGVEMFVGGRSGGAGASGSWEPDHFEFHSAGMDFDWGEIAGVAMVLVGLALIAFGAGLYVIYWAPEILPEAALNVLLASCLPWVAKSVRSKNWFYGVLRSTRIPLAVVLLVSLGFAATFRHRCPQARRLADLRVCMPLNATDTRLSQSPR